MESVSTLSPGFHGGNMDAPEVCPGNTVYFPVNVPGALLYLGHGHAAQGDGEVCGVAVEVPTEGVPTIEMIKGRTITTPRADNEQYLMSFIRLSYRAGATFLISVQMGRSMASYGISSRGSI